MKKFFILFNLITIFLLTTQIAYSAEALFLGSASSSENIQDKNNSIKEVIKSGLEEKKQKKGFFSKNKLKKIKKDQKEISQGYYGTLPDIKEDFKYKQQTTSLNQFDGIIPNKSDLNDENLKPAPYNDPLFLDVIVKKEKTSTYINDLQKTKFALNSLKKCIENGYSIQHFNGCVNTLDLYVKSLRTKYENRSESLTESYNDIISTNYYSKVLGNLLYDSNYYSKYVPTQQGQYSKANIELKKQELLKKINKTLFVIANES